jgi:thymidylate synthase (FAD)
MKLIKSSFEIINWNIDNKLIERCGRVCYQSESKGDPDKFVKMVIDRGHESVVEHSSATVQLIIDRGFLAEITRHRIISPSAESTRFCTYKSGCTFIIPPWVDILPGEYYYLLDDYKDYNIENKTRLWFNAMLHSENYYKDLLSNGWTPQQARSVLPNSLKTEVDITTNAREWRHIFDLRCDASAHPQMREIMVPLQQEFAKRNPILFGDV